MSQNRTIIFVCEHGAAKSVVAAAYFNYFARESGLDVHASARGTHPDKALSPQALEGLSRDGLQPSEPAPTRLTEADLQSAPYIVTFCDLPVEFQRQATIEHWDNIPAVSKNYETARDAIVERIHRMLKQQGDFLEHRIR